MDYEGQLELPVGVHSRVSMQQQKMLFNTYKCQAGIAKKRGQGLGRKIYYIQVDILSFQGLIILF